MTMIYGVQCERSVLEFVLYAAGYIAGNLGFSVPFIAARRRAVVVNEQVQIRNVIKLTLTLDHRYTDGGQVSGIYGNCVRYLEDPEKCVEDDAVAWGKTAAAATTTTTARIATKKGSSHET